MPIDDEGRIVFSNPNQFPIPTALPGGFQARQIIYREFDSLSRPSRHYYVDIKKPTPCQPSVDIRAFVRDVAINGYRAAPDVREVKPLDIPVSRDSYVILELFEASGYTFDEGVGGVNLTTRSANPPNNIYGALQYVDAAGEPHATPIPNCRIVYFAARHVAGDTEHPYKQGLNYNLKTSDGTVTIIDPDVRHPGEGAP